MPEKSAVTLDDFIRATIQRNARFETKSTLARRQQRRQTLQYQESLLPAPLPLPNLTRWHIATQDRLLFHMLALWGGERPRTGVDLGSHSSHGAYANVSDALLFLDRFHAPDTLIAAVDVYEDFALDLARRMRDVEPYASMKRVEKRSLALAIDCCVDDARKNFNGAAHTHATCCADYWCQYAKEYEARRHADHLCRMTRMRLGLIPAEPWLPPSSYPVETLRALANGSLGGRQLPRYDVRTLTLHTLWRTVLRARRIDWLKVDIDTPWSGLGGLERLLQAKAIGVMTIEIDGSWGGVSSGVSALDQLSWVARAHGYATLLKVPCKAKKGRGSLEAGSWKVDWKVRKWKVAESTHGQWACWLHPLAHPRTPWAPSRYHARRANGVQDALLLDADDASLRDLARRCASDCEAGLENAEAIERQLVRKGRGGGTEAVDATGAYL